MQHRPERTRAEQRGRHEAVRTERGRAVLTQFVRRRGIEGRHLPEETLELPADDVARRSRRRIVAPAGGPAAAAVAGGAVRGREQRPAPVDIATRVLTAGAGRDRRTNAARHVSRERIEAGAASRVRRGERVERGVRRYAIGESDQPRAARDATNVRLEILHLVVHA